MTAPRWISEAISAASADLSMGDSPGIGEISKELLERLPVEAIGAALALPIARLRDVVHRLSEISERAPDVRAVPMRLVHQSVFDELIAYVSSDDCDRLAAVVRELAADHDAVTIAELYQGACRALDAAGVPYAIDVEIPPHLVVEATIGDLAAHRPADVRHVSARPGQLMLDLAGRIAWLAQQRPTRLDLQRVEAERDRLSALAETYRTRLLDRAEERDKVIAERDRAQKELAECYAIIHSHQQRLADLHRQIVELEKARPVGAPP